MAMSLVSSIAASSTMTTVCRIPARAAVVEREQLAMNRRRMGETVTRHVLRDVVGRARPMTR